MRHQASKRSDAGRGRSVLPLAGALVFSVVLTAPAHAGSGLGVPAGSAAHPGSEAAAPGASSLLEPARIPDLPKAADVHRSPPAVTSPDMPTLPALPGSLVTPAVPDTVASAHRSGHDGSSADRAATSGDVAATAPVATSKTAAVATAVYVMRGRVVQVVAPSASAVGSVSFRVTASSRLATRLRGMVITVAVGKPTRLRRGSLVTVRLRAPADAMAHGFDSALALRLTATT